MTFEELMDAYYINKYSNNQVTYNNLLEKMKEYRVTPVIGAGLSCWADYPLWGELLKEISEDNAEVESLIANEEYEKAASKIQEETPEFTDILEEAYSEKNLYNHERYAYQFYFPDMFKGAFVTTNFDVSLEKLINFDSIVNPQDTFDEKAVRERILNHKHFLVKLHGSITDPEHMILTEESYNNAYGSNPEDPDENLSVPNTLRLIAEHNHVLFLGCSLGKDRTCSVLKKFIGAKGFALVELPENTGNEDEYKTALKERRKHLSEMNFQVIWYPHGQHEAVGVLINQLAEDMGIGGDPGSADSYAVEVDKQEIQYSVSEYFIGRDDIVKRIAEKIDNKNTKVLLVHGVAGIGKTEICKVVYHQLKDKSPDFSMPFIDIAETKSIAEFWERLAKGLDIKLEGVASSEQIFELICSYVYNKNLIVYLDNFEDVLSVGDENDRKDFINSLHDLSNKYGLRLLISSQEKISFGECEEVEALDGEIDVNSLSWAEFRKLDQVQLFIDVFDREPNDDERESFRTLISELSGHPLSIIITALYDRRNISINDLLKIWQDIETQIPGDKKDSHRSLRLATELPWRKIKGNKAAVFRWALHAHSIMPLDDYTFSELNEARKVLKIEPFEIMEWTDGGKLLRNHGLTEKTADGKERMLLALKKLFPKLGAEAEEAMAKAFVAWIKVCGDILKRGNSVKRSDYQACHDRALDFLPQCFNLAESCLEKEVEEKNSALLILLRSAGNFYQFDVINSIPLLNKLIEKTDDDFSLRGSFYYCLGNLLRVTGELKKALEAYNEAEKLYKSEQHNLGLANVLYSRGDLLSRTGELEKALEAYDEAEMLFKSEQDNLGLANVLRSRGDLQSLTGELEKALEAYDEAEKLYKSEQSNLGLANVLWSLGDLLSQTGDLEKALEAYDEAEKLYKSEQSNHGLANVLRSRGELLIQTGDLEKALEAYDEAEKLYKSEQANLGLANVLLLRGDLLSQTGELEKALKAYDEAEKLYKSGQANIGLANVIAGKGDLKSIQEDWKGAEEEYEKALPLYFQEQDIMGASYTLAKLQFCKKILGDDEGREKCLEELEKLLPEQPEPVKENIKILIELADSI
ncbi:MAG: tetratricopeptide repeat protein [Ruminococcus sp.]|nr:tetratricopeptide repeat protein [Ruminococcus sp.]